jgi:hypothetical protein
VAEVLGLMYGGAPPWGTFTPTGETVAVRITDTGTDLLVALGKFSGTDPDDGKTYEDEDDLNLVDTGAEPAATVTGTAADLDAWLWKRRTGWADGDGVSMEGDRITIEKLETILGQPLN